MTPSLDHQLERTILIRAPRDIVFRYFTDSGHFAAWWGAGSSIDPRPGGRVSICYPNGVRASGRVVDITPPERIRFTYGFESGQPIPPGSSEVSIALEDEEGGTRLMLKHRFADAAVRDGHVQGWRYQLAVFAVVVADEAHAGAGERVDGWFAAWSEPDDARRRELLAAHVAPGVRLRDRYSLVAGLADLEPHLAAVHAFMPGLRLERAGDVRQCQGTVLADWIARGPDGAERARGTSVFELNADGRIGQVVGLWA